MLVTLNDVLTDAKKNKYGVGLFNTVNLEMAKGDVYKRQQDECLYKGVHGQNRFARSFMHGL